MYLASSRADFTVAALPLSPYLKYQNVQYVYNKNIS